MINPAQYTQVLQQASDPQLMQMLKRPDKIPSQFVVAEINRRQSMRQAAMAERQRQAGVQEMMTAQQAMPQQQAMMPQEQRPVGMNIGGGGPNLFTALGMNTNPPAPERYGIAPFDPDRETISEYNFRVNQARRNKMAMERMAMTDAGMVTDEEPPSARPAESSIPTAEESGVREPFFKVGDVNPENVFSDGSPADIPKALAAGAQKVASSLPQIPPAEPYNAKDSARRGAFDKFLSYGGIERGPSIYEKRAAEDEQAALEKRYAGIKNYAFTGPVGMDKAPEGPLGADTSDIKKGNEGAPIGYEPGSTDFSSALGMGQGADDGKKKPSDTALSVVKTALDAMETDIAATSSGGIKGDNANTNNRPAIPTPVTVGGDKATIAATSPNATTTADDSATEGGIKNAGGPEAKAGGGNENPFAITSETTTFTQRAEDSIKEKEAVDTTIQGLMANANEDQAKALETYKTDMDALLTAQKNFMEVFEKNSMTPENRIFRSMIDAGLALAGSKEANFLNAVGEAGKVGIETFDRLNAEQKQNLFDKYSAAVDFQRAKVDVNTKINAMANQITQGQIDIAKAQRDSVSEREASLQSAAQLDLDAGLRIDAAGRDQARLQLDEGQLDLANRRFGFDQETGRFNMGIKDRAQTVNEMLANSELFKTVATVEQGDAKIGILAEQLGLDRDKLDWQKASTAIDQQLKAIGLDKPADSVAKLEWMKGEFGEDGLREILLGREKATTSGTVTEDDILAAATKMYQANPDAMIPGVEADNPKAAIDYYAKAVRTAFGQSGGGSSQPDDPLGLN